MGACTFITTAQGRTAKEAFTVAREDAEHEYGHGGYTGTIAEKHGFKRVHTAESFEEGMKQCDAIMSDFDDFDERFDKYGPAACIEVVADGDEVNTYIFFGWAPE